MQPKEKKNNTLEKVQIQRIKNDEICKIKVLL